MMPCLDPLQTPSSAALTECVFSPTQGWEWLFSVSSPKFAGDTVIPAFSWISSPHSCLSLLNPFLFDTCSFQGNFTSWKI